MGDAPFTRPRRRQRRPAPKCLATRRSFRPRQAPTTRDILWPTAPAAAASPAPFRRPPTLLPQPRAPATADIPAVGRTAARPGRRRATMELAAPAPSGMGSAMEIAAPARPGRGFWPTTIAAPARPDRGFWLIEIAASAPPGRGFFPAVFPTTAMLAASAPPGREYTPTADADPAPPAKESALMELADSAPQGSASLILAPTGCAIRKLSRTGPTNAGKAGMFRSMGAPPRSVCTLAPFPFGTPKAKTATAKQDAF